MNPLVDRRRAAYAMNALCKETGLGTLAHNFDGEEPQEWAYVGGREYKVLKNRIEIATVELRDTSATISVPDSYGLIRHNHIKEFSPREYGFMPQKLNWLKEPEPYVFEIQLPADIPGLHLPYNPMPRQPRVRKPKVRRAL